MKDITFTLIFFILCLGFIVTCTDDMKKRTEKKKFCKEKYSLPTERLACEQLR